ncbi:hypothetical protein CSB07_00485 [Candidatus Gracilibacteria bacterium]|nr:MAG: hypothetical protein CSB07_00485 [Candidatus Gracilibacteria bacterium]PIE85100.1 MAG: hypothetical protein CSA08_03580 [Candidatus Gracilibacteria bacterium]
MKKTIGVLVFIILLLVLFFPYQGEIYKDGGTKLYSSLSYQYVEFNNLEGCKKSKLVFFKPKKDYKYFEDLLCKKGDSESSSEGQLKNITPFSYSNLTDQKTQDFIKNTLAKYEISEKNIDSYFYYVDYFNDAVEKEGLTKGGFKEIKNFSRDGDYPLYLEKLENKNIDFMGTNCRISSFTLFKDFVNVENFTKEVSQVLTFDEGAINNFPEKIFSEKDKEKFYTFFAGISTPLVKDKQIHLKNIKKYFKEHNIKFNTKPGFSVISMFNHSDLDNVLFIGHIGVLLEAEGKFVFLEKLSFDLPYQAVIFDKKSEVKEYFMKKYGDMTTPETAKPFLMENDKEFGE